MLYFRHVNGRLIHDDDWRNWLAAVCLSATYGLLLQAALCGLAMDGQILKTFEESVYSKQVITHIRTATQITGVNLLRISFPTSCPAPHQHLR